MIFSYAESNFINHLKSKENMLPELSGLKKPLNRQKSKSDEDKSSSTT